jgi:hypothetical protein
MTNLQPRARIGLLVGTHLLVGLVCAFIAVCYPALQLLMWASVAYLGLVGTETLLLGMWVGLAAVRWWVKLAGLVAGLAWIECLALAPLPRPRLTGDDLNDLLFLTGAVGVPVLVVGVSCALFRWCFVRGEWRPHWSPRPVSAEMQFTLRSMITLTVAIALLLALGRIVQWIAPMYEVPTLFLFMFPLLALMASGMLVWAALGQGQAIVRVPMVLVGITLLGLLPPYYMGGPPFRFLVWPALTSLVAVCTVGSLLVIRSCGFRLVRRRPRDVASFTEI